MRQRAIWLDLFQGCGQIASTLKNVLAQFDLALVFSPQRQPEFLDRFRLAGIGHVFWLPSFPVQARVPIRQLQEETPANWWPEDASRTLSTGHT